MSRRVSVVGSDQFEAFEAIILSDQMPPEDVPRFLNDNPDFAEWYKERMANRYAAPVSPRN